MEQRTVTVIPAEPGWRAVWPIHSDAGIKELYEEPIIAWRVETVGRNDGGLIDRVTPVMVGDLPLEYILRRLRPQHVDSRSCLPAEASRSDSQSVGSSCDFEQHRREVKAQIAHCDERPSAGLNCKADVEGAAAPKHPDARAQLLTK